MTAKFEAFISYSHTDEKWAVWLHRALESYRIPAQLARELGRSRKTRPIFRDRDELASAGDLSGTLKEALGDSAALIVICSPSAANSQWVNQEISYYSDTVGGGIFCLLVDGDPASSFPPALTQALGGEPIAADPRASADGRQNAKLKLLAGLLRVRFDTLRQRDRRSRKQRLLFQSVVLSGAAVVASLTVFLLVRVPPCNERSELLGQLWSDAHRDRIDRAFGSTGVPYASDAWRSIDSFLTDYANGWATMHVDTCEATQVHREQSQRLLDLRMACLDERRIQFVGLREGFEAAVADTVENAVVTLSRLRPISRCADRAALEAAYPPPDDPAIRERVSMAFSAIASTRTMADSSLFDAALESAISIADSVTSYMYPPLEAEAQMLLGDVYSNSGNYAAAQDAYFESAAKAAAANDPELAAKAWLSLPLLLSNSGESDDAFRMLQFAESYVSRLPHEHWLQAEYHRIYGVASIKRGDMKGIANLRSALAAARAGDSVDLPRYLDDLSRALVENYQLDEAAELAKEAEERIASSRGSMHPDTSTSLRTLANIERLRGNYERAEVYARSALSIVEAVYPENHPSRAGLLADLGWLLVSHDPGAGLEAAQQALHILRQQQEPLWPAVAHAHNLAAEAYMVQGEISAARSHYEAFLEAMRETGDLNKVAVALHNMGVLSIEEGRFDLAEDYCSESLAIEEGRLRLDHPYLVYPLGCLGSAYLKQGNTERAIVLLDRAESIGTTANIDPYLLATVRFELAQALWESNTRRDQAHEYATSALEVVTAMGDTLGDEGTQYRDQMLDWLKQHDPVSRHAKP